MILTKKWLQRFGWPETLITGHPLAIAHRGASDYAPENTLKAFQIAADLMSEMWELDVHLSVDGVCVVAHDDDLTRVAGQNLRISEATWEEISTVRLPEGQHIPRFEEIIALARKTGCGLYIEIKSEGAGLLAWQLLQEAGFKFACLGSFNVGRVRELRELGCDYPLSVLVPIGTDPFDYLDGLSVDIVHLCWREASDAPHELLTDDLMGKLHEQNHQIILWHEDRTEVLEALFDKPVLGICSNSPERLKPYRQNPGHPVDIVCHRGANFIAPENTLEAAEICIDQGFQYVELDVRTTADGELVVIHDATLDRTTDRTGAVVEHNLSEIKQADAGGWFREGTTGYRVPTLAEFLELSRGQAKLYIEIKQVDPVKLLEIVTKHNMLEHCFFWSGDLNIMRQLRELSSDITLMATRWAHSSLTEAVQSYDAQIIEFDVEKDDFSEIAECSALGVRSMIYSTQQDWDPLASHLKYKPDLVNLDRPDRFKILASYPQVYQHFQAMLQE